MEPARGESCPSGQRRGPAAPEEDRFLSPHQKSLHISTTSTTPTTRGRQGRSPGSIPPRRVWKPQPHWVVADWLRLMEPARGKSCPSGQRVEVPPHPGRIISRPRIINLSISLQLQQPGDENADPPGRYRPAGCGNPNPTGWLLIGWGSWSKRTARVAPLAIDDVPPHTGRIRFYPRIINPPISIQL